MVVAPLGSLYASQDMGAVTPYLVNVKVQPDSPSACFELDDGNLVSRTDKGVYTVCGTGA